MRCQSPPVALRLTAQPRNRGVKSPTRERFSCPRRVESPRCLLDDEDVARIEMAKVCKPYLAGQSIFEQGSTCRGLFCIVSGMVAARQTEAGGGSVIIRVAGEGGLPGYRTFCEGCFRRHLSAALIFLVFFAFPAFSQAEDTVDLVLSAADSFAGKEVKAGRAIAVGPKSVTIVGDDGGELGTLFPGTPLKALANDGARVRIELEGWALVNYRSVVTSGLGERLRFARLNQRGQAAREVLGETEDPYGEPWEEVRLTGWAAKAGLGNNAASVWALADELFQILCNACHVAPAPDTYTANQWPGMIGNMAISIKLAVFQFGFKCFILWCRAKFHEIFDSAKKSKKNALIC